MSQYRLTNTIHYIHHFDRDDRTALFKKIGVDPYAYTKLNRKMNQVEIFVRGVTPVVANILKQEALSKDGEAAVARHTLTDLAKPSDVLLSFSERQWDVFLDSLSDQPFGLNDLSEDIKETLNRYTQGHSMTIGRKAFDFTKQVYVMGVLNVTPDSFSDGGKYYDVEDAVKHAQEMVEEGADMIDIGGESTRPGSKPITADEEKQRVIPVIEHIRKKYRDMVISIDTTKADVAKVALNAGADMVNDISAGRFDEKMFSVVAEHDVPMVLMHTLDKPAVMQDKIRYDDLIGDIISHLQERITSAEAKGIDRKKLFIDPGIGFGKTYDQNLEIINRLGAFKGAGCPILIGPSNKRFIGEVLNREPSERQNGTAAAVAMCTFRGANVVRVHQVRMMKDIVRMVQAIRKEAVHA